jgi:hypothetical protein
MRCFGVCPTTTSVLFFFHCQIAIVMLFGDSRMTERAVGDSIADINQHCLAEFRKHWQCLQNNNHLLSRCRLEEMPFNQCVFDRLVSVNYNLANLFY